MARKIEEGRRKMKEERKKAEKAPGAIRIGGFLY